MGTASFSVGRADESGRGLVLSSQVTTSNAFTTSTTAAFIEDAPDNDITMTVGELIQIHADEAMRIRFGGTAATASTGHYIPASEQAAFVCREAGKVSIIDVA